MPPITDCVPSVLTGFKFIGEQIGKLEQLGKADSYVFGFEESYGYLTGSYVRDKDGVDGAYMICEMFSYYATQGINLLDRLDELYKIYGYCLNTLHSYEFDGSAGFARMQSIMQAFRGGIREFGGKKVVRLLDYVQGLDGLPNSIDNVWSVLFTTDYLAQVGTPNRELYQLKIPNEEVRAVFKFQIQEWFNSNVQNDTNGLVPFWKALSDGDAKTVEEILTKIMSRTISVLDPKGTESEKEKFYHAFLSGMLVGNKNWGILSNKESGMGFADLMVETDDPNCGLIIELKSISRITQLDDACKKVMTQIHNRRYDDYLRNEGRNEIWAYGIAFYKKRCKVVVEKLKND